jgi:hypothetical protein
MGATVRTSFKNYGDKSAPIVAVLTSVPVLVAIWTITGVGVGVTVAVLTIVVPAVTARVSTIAALLCSSNWMRMTHADVSMRLAVLC